jgi:glycosyltransferase involved in cell wall biosynthesis
MGREGIGLSFLDAMAQGMVVIAANDATMNEYISHGVNGYLFDIDVPKPIDFGDYGKVRDRSISDFAEGREEWLRSEPAIVDFIRKKPRRISYPINKGQLVDAWKAAKGMLRAK